jgi:PAS domain S-box-containing protein
MSDPVPAPANAQLEHERLLTLINSMADGVLAVDELGKIVLYNGAALSVLDVNNVMVGTSLAQVLKPVDKHDQPVDVDELISQTKLPTINRDLRLDYKDGSTINLYLGIAPVHLGFGQSGQRGFVLQLRDITREKSLEDERDEFISVTSHELRTPIAIAEGNVSNAIFMTQRTSDLTMVRQALQETHRQINFLSELVNDLSMLSRAERGTLTVELGDINAHQLLTDLAANYAPQAAAKNLQLMATPAPNLELLHSSPLYVREILQNFITNAIKYTEHGHIQIGAIPKAGGVEFSVADTGIGISKTDQAKIFEKFFRSEDYRTRQNNGTGLGLYVTLKLAHLLQAQVSVVSQLDHGSVFTIFIPDLTEPKAA